MSKKEIDEVSGTQTTGHEWDGIKELDTPMPRWWLGIFWASIVWAIGYWVVYPAWPGISGYTRGILDHSQRDAVTANVAALKRRARCAKGRWPRPRWRTSRRVRTCCNSPWPQARPAFGDNCAPCHGAAGRALRLSQPE
jgi:cytochrome c oxidase cbb3-type subunit 3